jgi:hypothetical protein
LLFLSPVSVSADNTLNVYFAGTSGAISTALTLDKNIQLVSDVSAADVFVLNGAITENAAILARIQQGAGLVLILG